LKKSFNLEPLIKEYATDSELPTWFLNGYIHQDKIRAMREQMKKKIRIYQETGKMPYTKPKKPMVVNVTPGDIPQ
jgi:hypothetical protein